ncbi:NAD-dependent deacylase [Microbacterium sp. 77mftsu3.1]|uniref:NAD-dependent deacylase n=1 Tax=Microbacterium sp. 77mftsu3.1 TaxID=1761802 RepID=UPI0003681517|nr:NAD-dependent deacylase [Microbacterium sp. 77mftsu3.1]SDH41608.1 NAD-dependent deacetylase [Microbacterium sp. 77mftsu3.1]
MTTILVLTGAGISAESGIPTFRTPTGAGPALWAGHDVEDVATPDGYRRDPELVHAFYQARRDQVAAATPNAAHTALTRLAEAAGDRLLVVTQNVDDLHERSGLPAENLIHMHGSLADGRCTACYELTPAGVYGATCTTCGIGTLRPNVVWFGEQPMGMPRIERATERADIFIAIGTSGEVYPAAGLVNIATVAGAGTFELNLGRTSEMFQQAFIGPATETVPLLVDGLVAALR